MRRGGIELFSLRAQTDMPSIDVRPNEPVATIEYNVSEQHIAQIKCRGNIPITLSTEFLPPILDALRYLKFESRDALGRQRVILSIGDLSAIMANLNGLVLFDGRIISQ